MKITKQVIEEQARRVNAGLPLTIPLAVLDGPIKQRFSVVWAKDEPDYKAKKRKYMREYMQRPDYKAKQREYMREYVQRPEVKAKKREYMQRPEVKAKQREYMREYVQKPEVKAKKREYDRKRYLTQKSGGVRE